MLELGTRRNGKRVGLTDHQRAHHVHVLGPIGSGKSKLLELMMRQDLAGGRGFCLIDPHGTLSDSIERWCASRGLGRRRRIHVIKPGGDVWTPAFNPLRIRPGDTISVRVDAMVSACAQVWGGQDMNQTPRLKKVLRALFFALAARDLTLADALFLLRSGDPEGIRRALTTDLPDPVFAFVWAELNSLTRREFAEYAESTVSRLTEFLDSPAVRLMIGQQAAALDMREVMDAGDVVLVNLGSRDAFSYESARVVGSLIISDLFHSALGRGADGAKPRPFSLFIDEAYDFLSGDIEKALDQTRKFGLHLVLAHQRLGQLTELGEGIFSAVRDSTRTKIVFGGLGDEDAGVMARELFRDQINLEQPKHILDKPVVVGDATRVFESGSTTDGITRSSGTARTSGWAETFGTSATESLSFDADGEEVGRSSSTVESTGSSYSESYTESESVAQSSSHTHGWSEGKIDIREERAGGLYTLEEQLHRSQVRLRQLPERHIIVKSFNQPAEEVRVSEVGPPLAGAGILSRFRDAANSASPYIISTEAAEAEVLQRQSLLRASPEPAADARGDAAFWAE